MAISEKRLFITFSPPSLFASSKASNQVMGAIYFFTSKAKKRPIRVSLPLPSSILRTPSDFPRPFRLSHYLMLPKGGGLLHGWFSVRRKKGRRSLRSRSPGSWKQQIDHAAVVPTKDLKSFLDIRVYHGTKSHKYF